MDAKQKARLAVINHVMNEAGIGHAETVDIRANIETFFQDDKGWVATVTTSAHTDKSYRVTYSNAGGVTIVNEYTQSSESRLYDSPEPEDENQEPVHVNVRGGAYGYQIGNGNIQHNRF